MDITDNVIILFHKTIPSTTSLEGILCDCFPYIFLNCYSGFFIPNALCQSRNLLIVSACRSICSQVHPR